MPHPAHRPREVLTEDLVLEYSKQATLLQRLSLSDQGEGWAGLSPSLNEEAGLVGVCLAGPARQGWHSLPHRVWGETLGGGSLPCWHLLGSRSHCCHLPNLAVLIRLFMSDSLRPHGL